MRYLNLTMILASTVMLTLACSDSGNTDAADSNATGSETAGTGDGDGEGGSNSGDGDGDTGDGDGDTGDGDGDTGDGDGDTGDGDGDTGDGDGDTGDGDGDTGDGDGDQGCQPANDTPCAMCTAENCCPEVMACQADEDCACLTGCIAETMDIMMCVEQCMLNPNQLMNEQLMALRECNMANCMDQCAMP